MTSLLLTPQCRRRRRHHIKEASVVTASIKASERNVAMDG